MDHLTSLNTDKKYKSIKQIEHFYSMSIYYTQVTGYRENI